MNLTRRNLIAGLFATGGGLFALDKLARGASAAPGDSVEAELDAAAAAIERARAAHRASTTPTATPVPTNTPTVVPPTATAIPPTATVAPTPTGVPTMPDVRIVIPSYWLDNDDAIPNLIAANPPAGTVLCGGVGIRNSDGWYAGTSSSGVGPGQTVTRQQSQVARYAALHSRGLLGLTYIGIGELGGGYPASTDGTYNDMAAVVGKVNKQFALYPDETDGIFFDEAPYEGFATELAQLRDLVKSYGSSKLVVMNFSGWQDFDTEHDNSTFADIINVFESGFAPGSGSGPYFGNEDGDDGYAQPEWFLSEVAASKVCAWSHTVPNTQVAIDRAFEVCQEKGIGNLYLTDRDTSDYQWGAPPSASFMAKLFAMPQVQSADTRVVLTRQVRMRCPFCAKPGRRCRVCGGSGWSMQTEYYTPNS